MRVKTEELLAPGLEWLMGQIHDVCPGGADAELLCAIKAKQLNVAAFSGELSDSQIAEIFVLISDMKRYVTSKLGPEVDVPPELVPVVKRSALQEAAAQHQLQARPRC